LRVLSEYAPSFLEKPENHQQLQQIHDAILARVTAEENTYYASPKDGEDAAQRASGYDDLQEQFEKLSNISVWTEEQQKALERCATHFKSEAESLREDLPKEPDNDGEDSGGGRSTSEDVSINELFRDL
jgi:hypothetical protein